MKWLSVFGVLCVALWGIGNTSKANAQLQWKGQWALVSGSNQCNAADFVWIREGGGKFRFFDSRNAKQIWAVDQAPDGSVNAEVRSGYSNRPYRVTVPAGTQPRGFDMIDLTWVCRIRIDPR